MNVWALNVQTQSDARKVPTLSDVARAAGVSPSTASRVLAHSSRNVADELRERVLRAACDLAYVPNHSAQAVARGNSDTIAILVPDIADQPMAELVSSVVRAAQDADLHVTIALTDNVPSREAGLLRALRPQHFKGVVVVTKLHSGDLGDRLSTEHGVPQVGTRIIRLLVVSDPIAAASLDIETAPRLRSKPADGTIGLQPQSALTAAPSRGSPAASWSPEEIGRHAVMEIARGG